METNLSLQQTRRLGFCEQAAPWPEADLGPGDSAQVQSPRRAASRNSETIRLAHVPAHLLNSSAQCRDRIQSDAGIAATLLVTINVGCLYAGNLTSQTCCTSSSPRARLRSRSKLRCTPVIAGKTVNRL